MTKPNQDTINRWLNLFSGEKFAKWYNGGGNFDRWITSDLPDVTLEQLRQDLSAMCERYHIPQDNFTITSAIILIRPEHADNISLITTLPGAFPNIKEYLCLKFEAEAGKGTEYVQHHFPKIPIEIIDTRPKKPE